MIVHRTPIDERPWSIDWGAGHDIALWRPSLGQHGNRLDAPVVQSSNGHRYVFNPKGVYIGVVESKDPWLAADLVEEFWPLTRDLYATPWIEANLLRPSGCVLARVAGITGLAIRDAGPEAFRPWWLAYGHLQLGFYPSMGLILPLSTSGWLDGCNAIGKAAHGVRRAVLARLAEERRELRRRSKLIEERWT